MPTLLLLQLQPYFPLLAVVALILAVAACALLLHAHGRINKLMMGRSGASLEDSIVSLARRTKDIEAFRSELEGYLKRAEVRMTSSIRGVATVRFNPFKGDGSGGNQSFATALMTEQGDGCVISTLYSRERVSVYSKPIAKGVSPFELSEEEREALRLAKEQTNR